MSFAFKSWSFDASTGQLELRYKDSQYGEFLEQFFFPKLADNLLEHAYTQRKTAIDAALSQLFWMVGVSYYKTQLADSFSFEGPLPSQDQANWLKQTWQSGLAELAHQNRLPWLDQIQFPAQKSLPKHATNQQLKPRSLVAIGGGKDSLVSIEFLKSQQEDMCLFLVGNSAFITNMASHTSCDLLQIKRQVDPRLATANEAGAYNGHVPITAINSCVAVVAALLYDYDAIVFSNERSANVGNVQADNGQWVNHQYSKSFEFELTFQQLVHQHVASDLSYFSLLRPFSELAIVKQFTQLKSYYPYFSSCNRNFHLAGSQNNAGHWCGACPKCLFVFLMMAVFEPPEIMIQIFGRNLLDDAKLKGLCAELLGLSGIKPFECVGEVEESRWAMQQLSQQTAWKNNALVIQYSQAVMLYPTVKTKDLFNATEAHLIPDKRNFLNILDNAKGGFS